MQSIIRTFFCQSKMEQIFAYHWNVFRGEIKANESFFMEWSIYWTIQKSVEISRFIRLMGFDQNSHMALWWKRIPNWKWSFGWFKFEKWNNSMVNVDWKREECRRFHGKNAIFQFMNFAMPFDFLPNQKNHEQFHPTILHSNYFNITFGFFFIWY